MRRRTRSADSTESTPEDTSPVSPSEIDEVERFLLEAADDSIIFYVRRKKVMSIATAHREAL